MDAVIHFINQAVNRSPRSYQTAVSLMQKQ